MIFVDRDQWSVNIAEYFHQWGVPYRIGHLKFADAMFAGNGPDGEIAVGIELKTISDVLDCITSGRFAGHQLPGLARNYNMVWLIIEGQYFCDPKTGMLMRMKGRQYVPFEVGSRRYMYRDLDEWLVNMETNGGVRTRRTLTRRESAQVISDIHHWWQKKWTEHHAHLVFHDAVPVNGEILLQPGLVRTIAADLPHIGWKKSQAVADKFSQPGLTNREALIKMLSAPQDEWQQITGVGKGIASKVDKVLSKNSI